MKLTNFWLKPIRWCCLEENDKMYFLEYCNECKYNWVKDCTQIRLIEILNHKEKEDERNIIEFPKE